MRISKNYFQIVFLICLSTSVLSQETDTNHINKLDYFVQNKLYVDVGIVPVGVVLESNNKFNMIGFNADVGYKFTENLSVFISFAPTILFDKINNKYSHLNNSGIGISYSFLNNESIDGVFRSLSASVKGGWGNQYLPNDISVSRGFGYYELSIKCHFRSKVYLGLGYTQRFFEDGEIFNTMYPVVGFTL